MYIDLLEQFPDVDSKQFPALIVNSRGFYGEN